MQRLAASLRFRRLPPLKFLNAVIRTLLVLGSVLTREMFANSSSKARPFTFVNTKIELKETPDDALLCSPECKIKPRFVQETAASVSGKKEAEIHFPSKRELSPAIESACRVEFSKGAQKEMTFQLKRELFLRIEKSWHSFFNAIYFFFFFREHGKLISYSGAQDTDFERISRE